jgi:hypothetical protein
LFVGLGCDSPGQWVPPRFEADYVLELTKQSIECHRLWILGVSMDGPTNTFSNNIEVLYSL